jgi:hypothetical protein
VLLVQYLLRRERPSPGRHQDPLTYRPLTRGAVSMCETESWDRSQGRLTVLFV